MRTRSYLLIVAIALLAIVAYIFYAPLCIDSAIVAKVQHLAQDHKDNINRGDYCIVIDYSLPIYKKRLWVVDMKSGKSILNSHVSHAWNSGLWFASYLSNEINSEKSCIGAFVTTESYDGQYGYAMRIKGLNINLNDNAYERAIVFHKSYWPWSRGCFMTPPWVNRQMIDMTRGGSLVYVHREAL